jgi:hypothetical protein
MFGFTLHAGNRCHFLFHKHVVVVFFFLSHFSKKKKFEEEDAEFFIFLSFDSFSDIACVFA